MEVRLDDPVHGRLIGTAQIRGTGDKYSYATTSAALSGATGRHDVYLVFTSDARISTFSIR